MQTKTETKTANAAAKAFALACYLAALAGQAAFLGRVLLLGIEEDWFPVRLPENWSWAVNIGWVVLFAVQHSVMARTGFKTWWTRWVPAYLERSVYVGLSGVLLLGLASTWQPLAGEPLWRGPVWILIPAALGAAGIGYCSFRFDHTGLFGLRQVWEQGRTAMPESLRIVGLYRFVRHPVMAFLLLFLWAQPVLSPDLLLLSGGFTLYILAVLPLEERDLVRRFGKVYEEYRSRVPAVIPWRRPAPAATYPAVG